MDDDANGRDDARGGSKARYLIKQGNSGIDGPVPNVALAGSLGGILLVTERKSRVGTGNTSQVEHVYHVQNVNGQVANLEEKKLLASTKTLK